MEDDGYTNAGKTEEGRRDYGRTREVAETVRKVAARVGHVADATFQSGLLRPAERRRLQRQLSEIRAWAEDLLRDLSTGTDCW